MVKRAAKKNTKKAGTPGKPSPMKLPDDPLTLIRKRKNTELLRHMTARGLDSRIVRSLIAETYRFLVILGEGTSETRKALHFVDPNIQGKYRQAVEILAELLEEEAFPEAKRKGVMRHMETLGRWGNDVTRVSMKSTFKRENFDLRREGCQWMAIGKSMPEPQLTGYWAAPRYFSVSSGSLFLT